MWRVKFITKKSQAQTKHTLEHNKNLCSLQIASSQEDRLYSTNVCRKGWLLTLAAGLTRKKTSRREILGFAVLGNTVWGWQKSMHVVQIPFLLFLASISLLGKNVETYSRTSWLYICPIYTQSIYLWYIWPFLHLASKTDLTNKPTIQLASHTESQKHINREATHIVWFIWVYFHNVIEALCMYVCVFMCHLPLIKVTRDCALTASQAGKQRLEHNSLASWNHYLNDAIPHASISTHLEMEQLHHLLRHSNVSPSYLPTALAQKGSLN